WQGRFWLLSFIPGGFLGMTLFFASGMNWTVTLLGFLAGNCVGIGGGIAVSLFTLGESLVKSRKKPDIFYPLTGTLV
ncbi:hypothetical protein ACVWBO_20575, partial [Escherichia coli]